MVTCTCSTVQHVTIVNKANAYEARQTSLLYVFVSFFGLDRAQTTIDFKSVGATDQYKRPVKMFN